MSTWAIGDLPKWVATTLLLASALMCVAPSAGSAQELSEADADARELFQAGRVAYQRGRFDLALSQFQESYRLSERPALLYNIGTTLDRLRRDAEAIEAFERFIAALPDHENVAIAQERLTFLRARLASESSGSVVLETDGGGGGDDIAGAWWLWTIIGVVVVGAALGVGLGVGLSDQRELPLAGANAIVFAL